MISTTAILWGLLGAILIGVSDCIARVTAKAIPSSVLFLFIMGCSTAVLLGTQMVTANLPSRLCVDRFGHLRNTQPGCAVLSL